MPAERAHLARLATDSDRVTAEVRICSDRRQRRTAYARRAAAGLRIARERCDQAQALGAVACELPDCVSRRSLRGLCPRLLLFLLGRARGQQQLEVHQAVVAGCIQERFLRSGCESRKLRADDVTAILRQGHRPGAGNVCGGGVFLSGERILRGDGDAGQRDVAALDCAVQPAASDNRR